MKKILLCIAILTFATGFGQSQIWQQANESSTRGLEKNERASQPKSFHIFKLDMETLTTQLQSAPLRGTGAQSSVVIPFPDGNGNLQHFRVYKAPVMHKDLAAKYPGIESYVGQGIENPTSSIRFSVTVFGLHTMTLTAGKGTWYVDPYTTDGEYYITYKREELQNPRTFKCLTQSEHAQPLESDNVSTNNLAARNVNDNGNFRNYRLAIVTTTEYSNFHIEAAGVQNGTLAQKKAAVISAIIVTMTRVNTMYERDLSVSLQLIPQNDEIVFIDSDELTNDDAGALLGEGHAVMMEVIGTENFDMGHSFGTAGGGLAAGAPCSDFKGGAMTGLGSPVGDPFDIDYVAHEMGHQFGAGHTFNAECGGNRAPETAFETGGGTTILAYAGICDPVVQWSSDAQFHTASIEQMRNRINSISNCVPLINSGNTPPVANAGRDYVIPMGTAFILKGSATDADDDALTYMWDQMNNEISIQPPVPTATGGPNFRPMPISESPDRWIPRIEDVLNNNLAPQWEVIPTVGRDLDFALTVRDNNIDGGESHSDYMHIDVVQSAGPFTVVSPNTAISWQAASNQTVAWNVAGTTANGVNTPYVDILLSADGGFTYPFLLASKVPNDGMETVIVPNTVTPGRIMVRGHDNIFYDISNTNFNTTASGSTFLASISGAQNQSACKGQSVTYNLIYSHINGFNGSTTFTASGNPAGSIVTFSPSTMTASGAVHVTISNTTNVPVALHNIIVSMTSGGTVKTIPLYLNLLDNDFPETVLITPANNLDGVSTETALDWADNANASSYQLEVALDDQFVNTIVNATVSQSNYVIDGLSESTIYFWRVTPLNDSCLGNASNTYKFATGDAFCVDYASSSPVGIPNEVITVTSQINVTDSFIIENITVPVNITHTWLTDLMVKLISPAGTEAILFAGICGDQDDVNAIFDDNGQIVNCSGSPAITGVVMPQEALSAFVGENSQGVWTLEVSDSFNDDGGTINTWSVNLCGTEPAGMLDVVAAPENFNLDIYPNPNAGMFTIQFNMPESGKVAVEVYDMRGRRIFDRQRVSAGGIFSDAIQLNAEAGVYLVTVEYNGKIHSKKIIIK